MAGLELNHALAAKQVGLLSLCASKLCRLLCPATTSSWQAGSKALCLCPPQSSAAAALSCREAREAPLPSQRQVALATKEGCSVGSSHSWQELKLQAPLKNPPHAKAHDGTKAPLTLLSQAQLKKSKRACHWLVTQRGLAEAKS